jgi:hypothetical protein
MQLEEMTRNQIIVDDRHHSMAVQVYARAYQIDKACGAFIDMFIY